MRRLRSAGLGGGLREVVQEAKDVRGGGTVAMQPRERGLSGKVKGGGKRREQEIEDLLRVAAE